MSDRWFYAHDDKKIGPFSGQQLRDLAASRQLLPTDTVWKEGIARGVFATKVQYLFAPPPTATAATAAAPVAVIPVTIAPPAAPLPDNIQLQPETNAPAPPPQTRLPQPPARKRKAVAIKGAIIVSQDGTKVRFRKQCGICKFEETSWSMLAITDGVMRANFFCPKCRKKGNVELRGQLS